MHKCWIVLLLFTWSLVPQFLSAQTNYTIALSPSFPEPQQTYTASITGASSDIADITWSVDTTAVPENQGSSRIELKAPELGKSQRLTAQIRLIDGTTIRQSHSITPIRTDLIVTADTLAPGFYKGRKEASAGSRVLVSALTFTPPSQVGGYTYLFEVGGVVQNSGVPTAKNSTEFESGFEREVVVAVSVYRNGTIIDVASTVITLTEPEVHFYERNLLRGLLHTALRSPYLVIGQELRVRAEPYFIDSAMVASALEHIWKINNIPVAATPEDPRELVLLRGEGGDSARVTFEMYNLAKLLQSISGVLGVQF
jgi:hypothetical protein